MKYASCSPPYAFGLAPLGDLFFSRSSTYSSVCLGRCGFIKGEAASCPQSLSLSRWRLFFCRYGAKGLAFFLRLPFTPAPVLDDVCDIFFSPSAVAFAGRRALFAPFLLSVDSPLGELSFLEGVKIVVWDFPVLFLFCEGRPTEVDNTFPSGQSLL